MKNRTQFSSIAEKRKYDFYMNSKKPLSDWIIVPDAPHCCMRIIFGSHPLNDIKNRIAFIEKTPRVRISNLEFKGDIIVDNILNWKYGPKGIGVAMGEIPKKELYGFYPPSREWCDNELRKMGYKI